jgi:hypothetical protein
VKEIINLIGNINMQVRNKHIKGSLGEAAMINRTYFNVLDRMYSIMGG